MKKLLVLGAILMSLSSCEKEELEQPIVGCKCNDGSVQPGSDASVCGSYILTTNGISVTLHRGGVKEYIRSNKTFCQLFPGHAYCLGRNY
jgi:hypothetical protein